MDLNHKNLTTLVPLNGENAWVPLNLASVLFFKFGIFFQLGRVENAWKIFMGFQFLFSDIFVCFAVEGLRVIYITGFDRVGFSPSFKR